ncbi:acyltransferase family protein [Flavobacterium sp. CAN_S2]|uniref:acyltransferase family protein n=1 Tax=Flavobacterium sp. CAN_S2 TaxID=2787726 RepID=UPI0018CA5BAC
MEITVKKSNQLKAVAALMMLFLHLFNRGHQGLFEPLLFIGTQSVSYYISLFCDACVPIFCFVSGYGLYFKFQKNPFSYDKENSVRIKKLYINYWIILILFAVILGLLLNKKDYPGSLTKFFLNFSALDSSYNGAWWFFFTYLLLVATSAFLFRLIDRSSITLFSSICLVIYIVAFYFRVYQPNLFDHDILNWLQRQLSLFGTSLLPFYIGGLALKAKWNTRISQFFAFIPYKNATALLCIFLLVVVHGFIPNFVISPFLALPFLFLFIQINLPDYINRVLNYIAPHATNMWLVHMFFYMVYFEKFIYSATYVLPIFLLLVCCSILSSILVNRINNVILKTVRL